MGKLVELQAKCLPLGQNMIKFGHGGFNMSRQKACWKGYDGVDVQRWNVEVEPFVAQQIVQMEENMHGLGVVEDHMSPWGVARKVMCYYQFIVRLQEGRGVDQP